VAHCTQCGVQHSPDARFCGSCGAAVSTGRDQPTHTKPSSGQRKRRRTPLIFAALLVLTLAVIGTVVALSQHGHKAGGSGSPSTSTSGYVYFGHAQGPARVSGGWPSLAGVTRTLGAYLRDNLLAGDESLSSFYCNEFTGPPQPVDTCIARFTAADGSADWHSNIQTGGNPDGSFSWEDDSSGTQVGNYDGGTLVSAAQTPTPSTQATSPTPPPTTPPPTTPPPPPATASITPPATAQALTTFTGSIFSIGYPSNWIIDTNELKKPGYFDTTVRDPSDPEHTYLRIDYTPNVQTSLYNAANGQRKSQPPGYRELGFDNTTLVGYPAIRWEFEGYQKGSDGKSVFVHKVDIFMIDSSHTGWGVLVQAPVTKFTSWWPTFDSILKSFADTD